MFLLSVCCFNYRSFRTGVLLGGEQKAAHRGQVIRIFSLFIELDRKINFNEHFQSVCSALMR